jgi:LIVCS family branched-chain amino acid:cation transporter
MTACGEYFHTLVPKISYKMWVLFFSLVSFVIANFGLANIINFSIPVLMFLYPLSIALMLLTFLSKLFNHSRIVYVSAISVTFMISIIDGLKTFCDLVGIEYFGWLAQIVAFYDRVLPFYNNGLGWLLPVLVTILITGIFVSVQNFSAHRVKNKTESAL